jgi:hypothetical protein
VTKQVKSKQRVTEYGEVFTAERQVKAMCDLVKQETERIDSRFLEPACGDGNFLSEILSRKLAIVKKKYKRSSLDYEKNAILALSSIYGVDILLDNTIACRERLFQIWDKEYKTICKKECSGDTRSAVRFILSRNILCGNALSLRCVDGNGNDTNEPIIFSEWAFITGTQMQRKDYTFDELLNGDDVSNKKRQKNEQITLLNEPQPDKEGKLLKQYISDYRRVQDNG